MLSLKAYEHRNLGGKLAEFGYGPGWPEFQVPPPFSNTYVRVKPAHLKNVGLNDKISSVLLSPYTSAILFEHDLEGRFAKISSKDKERIIGDLNLGSSFGVYKSKLNLTDAVSSILLVWQKDNEYVLYLSDICKPIWNAFSAELKLVSRIRPGGGVTLSWNMWPKEHPSEIFMRITLHFLIDIPYWIEDAECKIFYDISLEINNQNKIQASIKNRPITQVKAPKLHRTFVYSIVDAIVQTTRDRAIEGLVLFFSKLNVKPWSECYLMPGAAPMDVDPNTGSDSIKIDFQYPVFNDNTGNIDFIDGSTWLYPANNLKDQDYAGKMHHCTSPNSSEVTLVLIEKKEPTNVEPVL